MQEPKIDKRKSFKATQLAPFRFKQGVSGNPKGRPKLEKQETLKEFSRKLLMSLPPEEKLSYLNELIKRNPEIVWKMAEGNPHQDVDNKVTVEMPIPILDLGTIKTHSAITPPETLEIDHG